MPKRDHIPLALKVLFTVFMAVMIPVYLVNYGPTNFLYFCDVTMLLVLAGLLTENALPISMGAVVILLPQIVWVIDFLFGLAGFPLTGMTAYMFQSDHSLFLRSL